MAQHTACITLGDNNFEAEVLAYNGFFVVVFGANWRGSCHLIAPVVEQVATAFAGRIRVGCWILIAIRVCLVGIAFTPSRPCFFFRRVG